MKVVPGVMALLDSQLPPLLLPDWGPELAARAKLRLLV